MVLDRLRVIQASFLGNRLQIAARHHQTSIVQPSVRGPATQLPPGILTLCPHGAGQRLPEVVQRKMEDLFSTSFSDVRIHVGPEASSIGAIAFTHGSDLYFAHGQYNPNSPHGLRLIGHELTHVLQQKTGRVRNPFGSGIAIVQDPGLEAEAERMGLRTGMLAPIQSLQMKVSSIRPLRQPVIQRMQSNLTIGEQEVEEVKKTCPTQCGTYSHDPAEPLSTYEWFEIKHLMKFKTDDLREKILKIGGKSSIYDCSNWSLGYREERMSRPPVTPEGVTQLYEQCNFKSTKEPSEAVVAVYLDGNNLARHVAVKLQIIYNSEPKQVWTSKLGESYLITHEKVKDLTGYPQNGFILFKKQ